MDNLPVGGDTFWTEVPGAIRAGDVLMNRVSHDRWLSVDEIAVYLGVKRDTVRFHCERVSCDCLP